MPSAPRGCQSASGNGRRSVRRLDGADSFRSDDFHGAAHHRPLAELSIAAIASVAARRCLCWPSTARWIFRRRYVPSTVCGTALSVCAGSHDAGRHFHDLRTPITALRVRAELIDDAETRGKILTTLDEIQRMTEATLAFLRKKRRRSNAADRSGSAGRQPVRRPERHRQGCHLQRPGQDTVSLPRGEPEAGNRQSGRQRCRLR